MNTQKQANILIKNALLLAEDTSCEKVFLFINSEQVCKTLIDIESVNDKRIVKIAKEIDQNLRKHNIPTYYDDGGTIGRRYARMDEIGTPFCITIDHESIKNKTVTIRDRDTSKQIRINIEEIISYFKANISIDY